MGKQPTIGQKKSKDAIARAAASSRKGSKKKWSKGKVKEKLNNFVLIEPKLLKDMERDIPRMRVITTFVIVEKFKVVAGVAKQVLRQLALQGKIKPLDFNHHQCTNYTGLEYKEKAEGDDDKKDKKGGAGKKDTKEQKEAKEAAKDAAKEAKAAKDAAKEAAK